MALLGYVRIYDNMSLDQIAKRAGVVLNNAAVWLEAQDQFETAGGSQAEVRINGLDYILINR